ncbi:hypothetical protein ZWY2020_041642 [Hordeum vulgare]|nr:hypothetical protein ZWY2020_041642 [Hordeum vulgare]
MPPLAPVTNGQFRLRLTPCWDLQDVCEKVEAKGRTTYNEVADEIYSELKSMAHIGQRFDEKNIRRRVYDAFNVLIALRVIAKEKKEIRWMGPSNYRYEKLKKLESEVRKELVNKIRHKKALLQEIEKQFDDLQNIKLRNETLQSSAENVNGIRLPFLLVKPEPQPSPASLAQRDALRAAEEFFSGRGSSDEGGDDEDEGSEPEDGGDAAAGFFHGLFERDAALRGTTSGAPRRGSSSAWGGRGRAGARPGGSGLHQARAPRDAKHCGGWRTAFAVVCRVLGWDVKRLHSIVIDPRGTSARPSSPGCKTASPTSELYLPFDDKQQKILMDWFALLRQSDAARFVAKVDPTEGPVADSSNADSGTSRVASQEGYSPWKEELECLVRGGLPMALRGQLWQAFVGIGARRVKGYYESLLGIDDGGRDSKEFARKGATESDKHDVHMLQFSSIYPCSPGIIRVMFPNAFAL